MTHHTTVEGKVVDLGSIHNGFFTFDIEKKEGDKLEVEFPFETNSDFSLLPFQAALLGKTVKYDCSSYTLKSGSETVDYSLTILEGPLKGRTYNDSCDF
ncbi:MAG: hypothetical protein KKF48_04815 [Nanoarchaeota archaeon]|nr:hypothetical protein [Nanoarchaeota archaeon]MBU1028339.1 hypothetical protein [Nanoarchaeota archaeon]